MPSEYKDKISDEDKATIEDAVKTAKDVLNDADADKEKFEAATKELSDKIMPIGAKMYQQADSKGDPNVTKVKSEDNKNDDDAVEGEVVDK